MRSRCRPLRSRAVAIAVVLVACGGDRSPLGDAPDREVAGPQGNVGQFVVECGFDRFAAVDPIVHPGHDGVSHLHQFFGAVGVAADSTYDALAAGATTCDQTADTAAYWAPALLDGGVTPIEPLRAVAYYRAGPGVDPGSVEPYPAGLMVVAGDPDATQDQPTSVVAWSCGSGSERSARPLDCSNGPSLRLTITFPDCWNGADLAPADRHVAYSAAGACPPDAAVPIPQLQFAIDFPPLPPSELTTLTLSSGALTTAHADFWNTWDQTALAREVTACIQRDVVCGVSG